jgi:transposase-like protein
MSKNHPHPETLIEAVKHFSDLDICHQYMVRIKWPDGHIVCPKCGGDKIGEIKSRRVFQCKLKECRKQFSTKVGTIFEDSPLGLDKWFVAVWCIVNAKNGISSYELGRALGVQQRSAWHMLHRIRLAMQAKGFARARGEIESDETFVGGKRANKHYDKKGEPNTGFAGKAAVHGLLHRGGDVRAAVVCDVTRRTLQGRVKAHVEPGSAVYTDAHPSYRGLDADYIHKAIDHAISYVEGRVHTNGLENFWSLLKRGINGTYVAVAPVHLQRYLDEQVFRFNKRKGSDRTRFMEAMLSVCDKRLTWAELTGATEGPVRNLVSASRKGYFP